MYHDLQSAIFFQYLKVCYNHCTPWVHTKEKMARYVQPLEPLSKHKRDYQRYHLYFRFCIQICGYSFLIEKLSYHLAEIAFQKVNNVLTVASDVTFDVPSGTIWRYERLTFLKIAHTNVTQFIGTMKSSSLPFCCWRSRSKTRTW